MNCDVRAYEVTMRIPVSVRVLAADPFEAKRRAMLSSTVKAAEGIAVGFPESITVKEVIKKPATEAV